MTFRKARKVEIYTIILHALWFLTFAFFAGNSIFQLIIFGNYDFAFPGSFWIIHLENNSGNRIPITF